MTAVVRVKLSLEIEGQKTEISRTIEGHKLHPLDSPDDVTDIMVVDFSRDLLNHALENLAFKAIEANCA